jgi:hypothetical protein
MLSSDVWSSLVKLVGNFMDNIKVGWGNK